MIGGAGVAAMALPSFLPSRTGGGGLALAQGNSVDAIAAELTRQFSRVVAGLAAVPPKGNARQIAAMYRMLAAHARATNLDGRLRKKIDQALASEGHHALVTRLVANGDYVAAARRVGIPTPPNSQAPDFTDFAKVIGLVKAGATYELYWRVYAHRMDRSAERFDRQMAIANGRRPSDVRMIRRIQDGQCEEFGENATCPPPEPDGDCRQNPDGSFSCNFVANTPSPTAPNGLPWPTAQQCSDIVFALNMWSAMFAILMYVQPELFFLWVLAIVGVDYAQWYNGC